MGTSAYGGTGGYRSFMGFDPKARVGVVALSNTYTAVGVDDIGRHRLDPMVLLISPPKEHTQVHVDPKVFDGYVGRYQLAPNFIITITRDGNHLFEQATGQSAFEIFPESERDYFPKSSMPRSVLLLIAAPPSWSCTRRVSISMPSELSNQARQSARGA
jgi:hypothetical protein